MPNVRFIENSREKRRHWQTSCRWHNHDERHWQASCQWHNCLVLVCLALWQISPAIGDDQRFDPQQRAAKHAIEMEKPAQSFFEGALLGNGGMGVVVCTRPDSVLIHFGHNDVWDIRVAEDNKDKLVKFEEYWTRVKRDTPEDRAWFAEYCKMAQQNYRQPYPRPWPCGSVLLGFDRRKAELLGHRVAIDTGNCEVFFLVDGQRATLELFADMHADRLWMRMVDANGRPIQSPFNRVRLIPENGMATTVANGPDSLSFRQVLPVLGDARDKDKALRMTVRVAGKVEPAFEQSGPFVAWVGLQHGLAKDISEKLSATGGSSASAERMEDTGRQAASGTMAESYAAAADKSVEAWKQYWGRAGVRLGDAFLEEIWYRNLYFLNCSVRPGATCPGLFANWSYRNIGTAWHGDYHTNYNLQQPFWVTFSSNHVDNHLPYVDLVHFLLPVSRDWAKNHYELPGAFFPHSAYPVEMTMMPYPVPTWGAEVCETPWVVQSLWWHYLYTMDADFLRERAFGPIREAVQFLNAYMRRAEAHGPQWKDDKFHIYPTVPPELYGLRPDPKFCADCNVDLTLTKFVFKGYLRACEVLAVQTAEASLMRDVRDILEHFPEYPTADSSRGKVFVSVTGEVPDQVCNTPNQLIAVFPGEDVGLHSPKDVLDVAINTWRNQLNEGGNDLVFLNLQGARLGQLDLERFQRQIRYCLLPDGTCTDMVLQAGGRYADDTARDFMGPMGIWFENFSLPVVINECMLQSYTGALRLFPNWPADKDAAFQDLRAVGAFLVSAEYASGKVAWIRVKAEVGGKLRVINPWKGGVQVVRAGSKTVMTGDVIEVDTSKGDIVELRANAQ